MYYPNNKSFAFSVFDDTDWATTDNVRPIYSLLREAGIITTKSVWTCSNSGKKNQYHGSQTLEDPLYLQFIKQLVGDGFEIGYHNATMESCFRERTAASMENFHKLLGFYPGIHANHESNLENLYWGTERIKQPIARLVMNLLRRRSLSYGHRPESPYYWGDLAEKHLRYVRNFVFNEINLRNINPTMPYHDPSTPLVKYWFSSADGSNVDAFNKLLSIDNQKKLEQENGFCIVYTHFGSKGFVEGNQVNPQTEKLLRALSTRNGWFVPAGKMLDYLLKYNKTAVLPRQERRRMEAKWFFSKILHGTT